MTCSSVSALVRVFIMYFNWSKTTFLATELNTGGWINIKMSSYQYRKSHCGDKTILRPSYLHNGISYTGKMTSLYWIRALNHNGERSLQQRHSTRFNELPTNKNELEQIRTNPKRPTVHVRRQLWFTVLNISQYSLRLHELWRSLQRATIFFAEPERTATNYNDHGDFWHEPGFDAVRQKAWQCELGLTIKRVNE